MYIGPHFEVESEAWKTTNEVALAPIYITLYT